MSKEIKRFQIHQKPIKTRFYMLPLLWIVVFFSLLFIKHKIVKENFKKIKGGCLIISNHLSFQDIKLLEKVIFPRRSFYVSSIDEFVGKEWIMRHLGCIPKKVHYQDMALVRNLIRLLKKGNIVTIYPEATYSFAGSTNKFDQSLGKLAKLANVPIVVIHEYGPYLYSPRWNWLHKNREVPLIAKAKMVVTKDELKSLSEKEIQNRINEYFEYDEYEYQRNNNIHIKYQAKAENIHRILFRCPNCENENCITGEGNTIKCSICNSNYEIDELSILKNTNGETKFDSISKWYNYQRKSVKESINNGTYSIEFPVRISRLINAKIGFDHNYATGKAIQTDKGIFIEAITTKDQLPFTFEYNEKLNSLIHLTFSVKGCRGEAAFEVHDEKESYLIYPLDGTCVTKIRFAVEEAHEKYLNELNKLK